LAKKLRRSRHLHSRAESEFGAPKAAELSGGKNGGLGRAAAKSVAERSIRRRNKSPISADSRPRRLFSQADMAQRGHVHSRVRGNMAHHIGRFQGISVLPWSVTARTALKNFPKHAVKSRFDIGHV
jgi:hypothetical protein